jgi:hypothetical protein
VADSLSLPNCLAQTRISFEKGCPSVKLSVTANGPFCFIAVKMDLSSIRLMKYQSLIYALHHTIAPMGSGLALTLKSANWLAFCEITHR